MTLRIGCDLDGVLADLGVHLRVGREAPPPPPAGPPAAAEGPTGGAPGPGVDALFDTDHLRGAPSDVWRHLLSIENFWETLDEIESGSVRGLWELAAERGWEVIFLTSRPASKGDAVQRQTQRWLARRGFELPSVFTTKGSRGRIASALSLDVLVDDNPENCLDVASQSDARPVLVWRGPPEKVPSRAVDLGIGAVNGMPEVLSLLDEADRAGGAGGLAGLFRKLLGRGARPR